jgi:hypothetical protein
MVGVPDATISFEHFMPCAIGAAVCDALRFEVLGKVVIACFRFLFLGLHLNRRTAWPKVDIVRYIVDIVGSVARFTFGQPATQ